MDGSNDIFDTNLGFHEIAVSAEGFAASALVVARKSGHHNDFNIFGFRRTTKDIEHIKATNFWHHNITDDKSWAFFDSNSEGLFPVAR